MASTYRKLHTKILDNTFLVSDNNAWIVFTKLMIRVNGKGELAISTRELAEFCNLSHAALYRTLQRLEAENIARVIATQRGKKSIIKLVHWNVYQSTTSPLLKRQAKQETKQEAEQLFTDTGDNESEQQLKQEVKQRRNSGETSHPIKNGPLDNRYIYNYKGFEIFDIQLLDEIRGFIDYRLKKDKGFTQRALDLNLQRVKDAYPDDIAMQRAAINESVARGWSGIFKLKDEPAAASGDSFKEAFRKHNEQAVP